MGPPPFDAKFDVVSASPVIRPLNPREMVNILSNHQVLSGQPKDTSRLDEAMYVKLLLPEVCKYVNLTAESQAAVQTVSCQVLFSLSLNNFSAVFSRISSRYEGDESDHVCKLLICKFQYKEMSIVIQDVIFISPSRNFLITCSRCTVVWNKQE